jgi:hypothetical protein
VAVFVSLTATVSLTCLLLLALATPPLTSSAWRSLFAADSTDSVDSIFDTQVPVPAGRWRYIYVHQSATPGGDAVTLSQGSDGTAPFADHFVVGNGDGCVDGEIQMTQAWNHQEAIRTPPPGAKLSAACVSICLVGDFSHTRPTAAQMRRLGQLINALQSRFGIPAGAVFAHPTVDTAAGAGHAFPTAELHAQLLQP